jgi:putative glutamine amidotransferase
MDRKRPVIGISAYDVPVDFGQWRAFRSVLVPQGYVRAVVAAGGIPVLVPPTEVASVILDDLDGMVFTGGSDINPAVYGQEPHPESSGFYDHRDSAELELMRAALARSMPVLGICRGMQLLNVARGGDLVQHLPDVVGDEKHKHDPPGVFADHDVDLVPGTQVQTLLGDRAPVKSHHHQGFGRLGEGLQESARADDGTIEAVEDPSRRFTVGVLWHPEAGEDFALFQGLVDEARRYAEERR